jgi:predicted NUDIX family NTP pyrophosphohydrolase
MRIPAGKRISIKKCGGKPMTTFFRYNLPMPKISSGLLMFRRRPTGTEVLLVHPGGPLWGHKDEGYWSIPKGEIEPGEDLLAAAQREFEEETGLKPTGPFTRLQPVTTKSGKVIHAWAFEGDCDVATVKSNTFTMEWAMDQIGEAESAVSPARPATVCVQGLPWAAVRILVEEQMVQADIGVM